jgi:hypothetical protein
MSKAGSMRVALPALAGAALLSLPASVYRVDRLGIASCAGFPSPPVRLACAAAYGVAALLLALAWRESLRQELTLAQVFAIALPVHGLALLLPPFLSLDPMFYAAAGKALVRAGPHVPIAYALPGDPWLELLPASWREGTSPYFAGFDQLARAIAWIAGDRLWVALRAYQWIGLACMLAAAAPVARAFDEPRDRARAASLVILSPLAIIEATQSGHNDALLALTTAAFAWATMRARPRRALVALAAGLLVKASAAILLAIELARRAMRPMRASLTPRRVLAVGTLLVIATLAGFLVLERRAPDLQVFGALLGTPQDALQHCTRSVECLPRAALHHLFGRPRAAWTVGLAFRFLGGLWLISVAAWAAARAEGPRRVLGFAALALFIYYLFFHGYMQSWYLLPLLPLAAFADARLQPAMCLAMTMAVLYYPLDLMLGCTTQPLLVGVREFCEAFSTVVVPAVYLAKRARA